MEITQENIEKVILKLKKMKIADFNGAMLSIQDYVQVVEKVMKENPDATLEEICEIFDKEQDQIIPSDYKKTTPLTEDKSDKQYTKSEDQKYMEAYKQYSAKDDERE